MSNENEITVTEERNAKRAPKSTSSNATIAIVLAIVAILVVAFIGLGLMKQDKTFNSDVKTKQYQAVFLTNGQVYFGKIKDQSKATLKLENIYYLQVQQDVQPADDKAKDQNLSLAKLGKELHGPEDVMYIDKDQVLFWENLKNDSQVVKAIKDAKK